MDNIIAIRKSRSINGPASTLDIGPPVTLFLLLVVGAVGWATNAGHNSAVITFVKARTVTRVSDVSV